MITKRNRLLPLPLRLLSASCMHLLILTDSFFASLELVWPRSLFMRKVQGFSFWHLCSKLIVQHRRQRAVLSNGTSVVNASSCVPCSCSSLPAQAQLCKHRFKSLGLTRCQLERKVNFQQKDIVQVGFMAKLCN